MALASEQKAEDPAASARRRATGRPILLSAACGIWYAVYVHIIAHEMLSVNSLVISRSAADVDKESRGNPESGGLDGRGAPVQTPRNLISPPPRREGGARGGGQLLRE